MNKQLKRRGRPSSSRRRNTSRNRKQTKALDPATLIQKKKNGETRAFKPAHQFQDIPLHGRLKANLAARGYESPTEIQQSSLEPLLEGRDLVGVASTGTGKTAAFLIPLIERLLTEKDFFTTLIVVPTRELALQVEEEFNSLAKGTPFKSACFIGGTNVDRDIQKLRHPNHFLIGTPGRLLDMADRGALRLDDISVLILDEFDRMLDMGFIQDIRKIVNGIGYREQTMLFSATMDPSQKNLVGEIVNNPLVIKVSNGNEASTNVDQHLIYVNEADNKYELLVEMISADTFEKVIIFAETKRLVDKLSKKLNRSGVNT
ncbi:MAG: DEAD/DEAH box helicase, partial [Cyclobacteriaceae bacterium]